MSEEDQILAMLYQAYPLPCSLEDITPVVVQKLLRWAAIEPINGQGYRITAAGFWRLKRRWPDVIGSHQ